MITQLARPTLSKSLTTAAALPKIGFLPQKVPIKAILGANLLTLSRNFSNLDENQFLNLWEKFQQDLVEELENDELGDGIEDFEDTSEAVSLECGDNGTFVISRHIHNREIWYSSPISGPSHFSLKGDSWVNKRGEELRALLEDDLSKLE